MAADYTRIHRLLKILTLIQSQSGWTAKSLAQECGTTERNIYRDLKMLEGAGIPYYFDDESGGYVVRGDFFLPAVSLTVDESLALVTLGQSLAEKEQLPLLGAAGKAIAKIRCNLPTPIKRELDKLDDRVAIKLAAASPSDDGADVYEKVRQSLAERRVLCCAYDAVHSGNGHGGTFEFRPYTLFFGQRAWYAVGKHSQREGLRCLKLSRFTRCQITDKTYAIPADFSLEQYLGNAWRMIRGDKTHDVELHFDAEFADTVAETHWHHTQQITRSDDDSITFRCKVDGLEEIVWWVLSMGPHCVVHKPVELATLVRELAQKIVERYATTLT